MRQMGILRDADKERMPLGGDVGTSGRYREMIDSNQYNETYGSGKIGPPRVKAPSNSTHPTLHGSPSIDRSWYRLKNGYGKSYKCNSRGHRSCVL
jgi:hypothetical protein